jgi:MFS family permease
MTPAEGSDSTALAVLRLREVQLFVACRFFSATAGTLLRAAFGWHLYALTDSAFHLGLVGLVQFLPVIPTSLVAGAVADTADRVRVVQLAQTAMLAVAIALVAATRGGDPPLPLFYALVFALAAASAFEGPARSAILPTLVPRERFPSAVAVHSSAQNLAWVTGPVAMGFVVDALGIASAYAAGALLVAASIALLAVLHARRAAAPAASADAPPAPSALGERRVSAAAIREGVAFVWSRPAVLGAMSLDMFAVIFASVTALLPIYAEDILRVGARGYGLLASAMEAGTVAMAGVLLVAPPIRRLGRALVAAVAVFGVAAIAFGASRSFPLSLAALVVAGMADQVSMVTRSTLIQLATPDALRGRVSSVSLIFISASNQLGAVESGFLAAATSAPFSAIFGGVACLAVLAAIALRVPELRRYRL